MVWALSAAIWSEISRTANVPMEWNHVKVNQVSVAVVKNVQQESTSLRLRMQLVHRAEDSQRCLKEQYLLPHARAQQDLSMKYLMIPPAVSHVAEVFFVPVAGIKNHAANPSRLQRRPPLMQGSAFVPQVFFEVTPIANRA